MTDLLRPDIQFWTAEWVLPVSAEPIRQGFVAVMGDKVVEVGRLADLPDGLNASLPLPGSLLVPGFVNTHTHLEQSYASVVDKLHDAPFSDWLLDVVKQNRLQGSSEEKATRALQGCRELLSTGTTCVNDLGSGAEAFQAIESEGLRGFVSLEFFHPQTENVQVSGMVELFQALKASCGKQSRLRVGISPHSPYNFSPIAWKALMDECEPSLVHAHAAESLDETLYFQGKPSGIQELHQRILGRTFQPQALADSPIAYLSEFGLLNNRTILAHAVQATAQDRQLLADSGVTVTHCPRSNLFLLGKTLQFADWVESGVVMGLGTDGRVSTENLDLRDEALCAMELHGWSARQALEMMTLNGAKALRLETELGSLESGKSADFVLWQTKPNGLSPEEALMSNDTAVQRVWTEGRRRWEVTGVTPWTAASVH